MAATTREIRFNKELYSQEGLDEALQDWSEVGTFSVSDADDHLVVVVESIAEGEMTDDIVAEVLGELENYVLSVEVNRRK